MKERRRSESLAALRNRPFKGVVIYLTGKSVRYGEPESSGRLRPTAEDVNMLPRKSSKHIDTVPVPETDTGSQGENPEVLE